MVIARLGDEVRVVGTFDRERDAQALATSIVAHDYAPEVFIAHVHDAMDLTHPAVRHAYPSLARAH